MGQALSPGGHQISQAMDLILHYSPVQIVFYV